MASEQFSLCWDNFHKNMSSGMNSLLESEDLVDVTLAVQGKCLKAHKMVLSVCSPYFKELFKSNPCQHPIVFMKDVSYEALSDLLQFMYQGEVQVSQENLTTFIKTAEALQIKGLTGDGNGSTDTDTVETPEKPMPQPRVEEYRPAVTVPRPKKQPPPTPIVTASPSVKRQRLSQSSDSQPLPPVITKTEPISTTPTPHSLPSEPVHFKMEPYDQPHSLIDETGDDNFGDETLDDTAADDTEDYSMMESHVGGEDEPQAGTSTDGAGEGQVTANTQINELALNPEATVQTLLPQSQPGVQMSMAQASQANEAGTSQEEVVPRPVIWVGHLQWSVPIKNATGQTMVTRFVPCRAICDIVDGKPQVKADCWPLKLVLRFFPAIMGFMDKELLRNAKRVLFLTQPCESWESLNKHLSSGYAAYVPLIGSGLLLLHNAEKGTYVGYESNNQDEFLGWLKSISQQLKSKQQIKQGQNSAEDQKKSE